MIIKNKLRNIDKIGLLIFDVDQTLTLSDPIRIEAAFKHFGLDISDDYASLISFTERTAIEMTFNDEYLNILSLASCYERHMPLLREKGIREIDFAQKMLDIEFEFVREAPLMGEVLKRLSEYYRIVCLTNWFGKSAMEKLIRTSLCDYIETVYTCETNKAKPHEESYLNVLKAEGFSKDEALMIGDGLTDVKSSMFGIQSIWANYDNRDDLDIKKYSTGIISEPIDLIEILKRT